MLITVALSILLSDVGHIRLAVIGTVGLPIFKTENIDRVASVNKTLYFQT